MAALSGEGNQAMPRLHINGIDLHFAVTGQGQPVLFIHGLGSSSRDWEPQTAFFARRYQVVTFDLRGHGQSQKPPGPYSMLLFASDAAQLLKALGLAPAHVVGISLGGMIALQLAADSPASVRSLVVVNTGPEYVVRTMKERWQVASRLLMVRLLGMRRLGEVLGQRLFPKPGQIALRQLFAKRWEENDPRAYLASMRAIIGWSVTDRLAGIGVPTLVVAADQDYTPVKVKEDCVARMPQAELVVIRDSRHATPVEHPVIFNETTMAFLARQAPDSLC
jgi:pimeloyl-ACP methyl ester carboxylesterase